MCGKINEDDFYVLHHEMGKQIYILKRVQTIQDRNVFSLLRY